MDSIDRSRTRTIVAWAAVMCALAGTCSRGRPPLEGPLPGSVLPGVSAPADVLARDRSIWLAYTSPTRGSAERIHVLALEGRRASRSPGERASGPRVEIEGRAPRFLALADGAAILIFEREIAAGKRGLFVTHASSDGRSWNTPSPIVLPEARDEIACGRPIRTARGTWIVPAVRDSDIVCLHSSDGGASWQEGRVCRGADPALAGLADGSILLVLRREGALARCLSSDDGLTWSAPRGIGLGSAELPHALQPTPRGVLLAWTDPPDSTQALPGVWRLRLSMSSDGGSTWRALAPLALRAGVVPAAAALAFDGRALLALIEERGHDSASSVACVSFDLARLEDAVRRRDSFDARAAARTLALLCQHTLERPVPSQRLFIEGYFMRTYVAAYEVLGPRERDEAVARGAPSADTDAGLLRARSFAEWMLTDQNDAGYWPLGYKAVYVADMAAVVGLFAALEPHVEAAQQQRYQRAAVRFVQALRRDGMLLPNGACGVGWMETRSATEEAAVRDPYLVSTALAGIEVQAWLYHRTHDPEYRRRAIAALDWTLGQMHADGSFDPGPKDEGPLAIASYVQEGWMAADAWLDDGSVRERLRRALPAHVGWLLRLQRPDGTWTTGADGEFARTPAVLDFLVWYDQRIERRDDVRAALRRGSAVLLDPERWHEYGLFRSGKHEEVLRAIAGRPLAALAAGRFVL